MNLQGAKVLVTGATGGLGRAIALELRGHGSDLVLTGRRSAQCMAVAREVGGIATTCDLVDPAAVSALAEKHPDIDILISNAALPAAGAVSSFTAEEIRQVVRVNLVAAMELALVYSVLMRGRGRGHIVFVSSMAGKVAAPGSAVYSATKFGLRGFAQGLRADLASDGIGVSTLFPGFISDTGMFADSGIELPRGIGSATSSDVTRAVVRVISENRAEADVAPLSMRFATVLGQLAPELLASIANRIGAKDLTDAVAVQRHVPGDG